MVAVDSQPADKASVTVICRTPVVLSGKVTVCWLAPEDKVKLVGVTVALGLLAVEKLKVCVVLAGLVCLVILIKP